MAEDEDLEILRPIVQATGDEETGEHPDHEVQERQHRPILRCGLSANPGFRPPRGPETFLFFEVVDGRTKVTSIGHMGSAEAIESALASGMVGGAIETWDRLEALLAEG